MLTHAVCDDCLPVASCVMIKVLEELLDKISRKPPAKKPTPTARPKWSSVAGDFRAVSIEPSLICCAAAMRGPGGRYLMRKAPRLPLEACTMPADCSCKFRKSADRRESDRRVFGAAETNRWFAGSDNRKLECRRSA